MSDDDFMPDKVTGPYPGPDSIPRSDVLRFFEAKLPDIKCSLCGKEDFEIFTFQRSAVTVLVEKASWVVGEASGTANVPVLDMACNNCGQLYKFAASIIIDWLQKNPAPKS